MSEHVHVIHMSGLHTDPSAVTGRYASTLTEPLMQLCQRRGWVYQAPPRYRHIRSFADGLTSLHTALITTQQQPTVIVATSLGAWFTLGYLADDWPDYVKGLILLNPAVGGRTFAAGLSPAQVRMARWLGFPRANGQRSFWIGPRLVRDLLNPVHDLFLDGRLEALQDRNILMLRSHESSVYRPSADYDQLLRALQQFDIRQSPELVMELIESDIIAFTS